MDDNFVARQPEGLRPYEGGSERHDLASWAEACFGRATVPCTHPVQALDLDSREPVPGDGCFSLRFLMRCRGCGQKRDVSERLLMAKGR
jgi:hypothetical protein